jgi:hypothetical protein
MARRACEYDPSIGMDTTLNRLWKDYKRRPQTKTFAGYAIPAAYHPNA